MLSLPPHTSHRMQPLDVSFFGPFKAAYRRECDLFMKSQLSQRITPYDIASLIRKTFSNVASMSKGEAELKATDIFPVNPNVFSDEDFMTIANRGWHYRTFFMFYCTKINKPK